MKTTLNGRPVVDVEVDGIDFSDAPDFCDAYFSHAVWGDTLVDLTDEELEQLGEDGDFLYACIEDTIY
jgi:hypothetical protein